MFHSYSTEKRLKRYERVCNDHDYCHIEISNEDNKTLEYNYREKSLKVLFIIHADLECLLEKMNLRQSNPKKSYTEKKAKHIPSGYAWITCCSFDQSKNDYGYYRDKDCMESFCKDLRDQAMEIINYEEKEMIPLTDKETEFYEKQNICHICRKELCIDENDKNKKYKKCGKKWFKLINESIKNIPIMYQFC